MASGENERLASLVVTSSDGRWCAFSREPVCSGTRQDDRRGLGVNPLGPATADVTPTVSGNF